MIVTHELIMRCQCPVNLGADIYQVRIETNQMIKVEDILTAIKKNSVRAFQEDITQSLAADLECTVTTIGYHSGVKTTCVC